MLNHLQQAQGHAAGAVDQERHQAAKQLLATTMRQGPPSLITHLMSVLFVPATRAIQGSRA